MIFVLTLKHNQTKHTWLCKADSQERMNEIIHSFSEIIAKAKTYPTKDGKEKMVELDGQVIHDLKWEDEIEFTAKSVESYLENTNLINIDKL